MKTLLNLILNITLRVVLFVLVVFMTFLFIAIFPLMLLVFFIGGFALVESLYNTYFDAYGWICEELIDIEDGRIKNWFLERYNKLFSRRLKG